ncbi:DUF6443 domain-containing protein [Flavobacterium pectinovorum]|uniref:DUF6443 domain-containing protein n=1 Tax=Flavobacterium pectinovorum TaxID=29533 RepID=UPI00265FA4A5|nr:DUF6443 domain-containing protein [Flavobacterium pectinovorum]WKL47610.1 DUF6443 domain-containing protein [Flavobacterium pectinovorum]
MKRKLLFIKVLLLFVFSGYGQEKSTTKNTVNSVARVIVEPDDPGDPGNPTPPSYQWNRDADGDGYGDPADYVFSSTKPRGYVANQQDCDDSNPNIKSSSAVWYRDVDKDGYGGKSGTTTGCFPPVGYAYTNDDIDDNNPKITNITPRYFYSDWDRDGFGNPNSWLYYSVKPDGWVVDNTDCNDDDITINPNTSWYRDVDGDGYGTAATVIKSCIPVAGYVRNSTDLNDANANITNIAPQVFYYDNDGDGYGNPAISDYYSVKPIKWVLYNNDCNDNDASINPANSWYYDGDGDGYGLNNTMVQSCTPLVGYVRKGGDYDDTNVDITSGPPRLYYYDNDRDGWGDPNVSKYYSYGALHWTTDNQDCNDYDASLTPYTRWYPDTDADGYGSVNNAIQSCIQPSGYVRNYGDYDDNNVNIINIAPKYFYPDVDGDGYGSKDNSLAIYYSVQPVGYVTNNEDYSDTDIYITNIAPHDVYVDADGDGFGAYRGIKKASISRPGYVDNQDDCNDTNGAIHPNTKWYADGDGDGLGDPANFLTQCFIPVEKYVLNDLDNCPLITGTSSDCSVITTPSTDQNYIITKTYKKPLTAVVEFPALDQVQNNITYFDGLGRPMQQISSRQSSLGTDIITHIGYDDYGRQVQEYLPFKSQGSAMEYEENAKDNTVNFYNNEKYENTSNPFSQKQLEASPLSRIIKQAAPGTSWAMDSGHEIKLEYKTNTADEVKLYQATTTWDAGSGLYETAFSDQGKYAEKQLYKNVTYDENNSVGSNSGTEEFKNKEGQVVLKRTYEAGAKHDTYYVYDTYGNLTYVIPPKADGEINDEVLNGLCYQYKYDYRNRLAEKKLPGKQWEFIVYDKLDRPVAVGPALSPFKDDATIGWLITKYDAFSRPIYTGWSSQTVSAQARKTLQDAQNNAETLFESKQSSGTIDGIAVNYTNTIAPTSFKLLTVNYYDDYSYPNAPVVLGNIEGDPVLSNVKGLGTGNWTRVPTTASAMLHETSTIFYDLKSRPIRTYSQNHLGGYTVTDSKLDFTGKPLYTISKHKRTAGDLELTVKEEFTYSLQDRLLTHTHQINGGVTQLLASNTYDDLGQLISKNVGNSTGSPLQKVDYKYNIRGWLTGINETDDLQQNTDPVDLFAFKINYDKTQTDIQNVKALYNGNIAETFWKVGSDNLERSYGYQYDNLNRLTNAVYQKLKSTTEAYNENLSYDKNGNIMFLNRNGDMDPQIGPNSIDNLVYTYPSNSNQLFKVVDNSNNSSGFNDANKTGDDYAYDDNGNLISDKNKNITSILYNQLNLPKKIIFGTGNTIEYIYNAAGQKLEKIVTENNVAKYTNYLGGFQYKDNVLEFFPTAEGYVKNENSMLSYIFQYKDHLGNVRLSYARNPTTQVLEIIEEDNYYPFGLKHKGYNDSMATNNTYKYNGKELQDELGLGVYDYGARNYDPALGRWMNIDPLAEKGRRWSPYNYAMDNPVYFIDPDGMWPDNPITGLINRATSAVKNYVANKISTVVSNTRNILSQKASAILDKITPDVKIGKAEKAQKGSGSGVSFATEGGKQGGMTTDQGDRKTKQVDMSVVVGLTDVYGAPTTIPGVAPDGSNPFVKSPDGGDEVKSEPTMNNSNSSDEVTIETENSRAVPAIGINPSQVQTFKKDTVVKRSDISKVRTNDAKEKNKAYEDAKRNNSGR